jgi:hypothetical protein
MPLFGAIFLLPDETPNGRIAMSQLPHASSTTERSVYFRTAESGVRVVFISLIVKMHSIDRKYLSGVTSFFRQSSGPWEMDGKRYLTASMADDLDDLISLLESHGMQCSKAPADYYLICADFGVDDGFTHPVFLSTDGGELELYFDQDKKLCAVLG